MRFLHKLYAKVFGYFWIACPICGEYFGGHEIDDITAHSVFVDGQYFMVCPKEKCNSEAISRNLASWYRREK